MHIIPTTYLEFLVKKYPEYEEINFNRLEYQLHPIERQFLEIASQYHSPSEAVNGLVSQYITSSQLSEDEHIIYAAMLAVANQLEAHGLMLSQAGFEPHYHNRRHAIEVMSALVLLLNQESSENQTCQWPENWPKFQVEQKLMLMLAALGHDFKHPGGVNVYPSQLETMSASHLANIMQEFGMPAQQVEMIKRLILATEFEHVPKLHAQLSKYKQSMVIDWFNRAAILLTEADIFPSILPEHGWYLAGLLSQEWHAAGVVNRPNPNSPVAHKKFLSTVCFSSPHSQKLNIQDLLRLQLLI